MATDSLQVADHYATPKQRRAVKVALKLAGLNVPRLAAEMRLSHSHLYGMLNGTKPMAFHYLLSIKYLLMMQQQAREAAEQELQAETGGETDE